MENLSGRIENQKVSGKTIANYLAELMVKLECNEIELETAKEVKSIAQQINVHHKNIIDAQREDLRRLEFESENINFISNQ